MSEKTAKIDRIVIGWKKNVRGGTDYETATPEELAQAMKPHLADFLDEKTDEIVKKVEAVIIDNIESAVDRKLSVAEVAQLAKTGEIVKKDEPKSAQNPADRSPKEITIIIDEGITERHRQFAVAVHPDDTFTSTDTQGKPTKGMLAIGDDPIYDALDAKSLQTICKALKRMPMDRNIRASELVVLNTGEMAQQKTGRFGYTHGAVFKLTTEQAAERQTSRRSIPTKKAVFAVRGIEEKVTRDFMPGDFGYEHMTRSFVAKQLEREPNDVLLVVYHIPAGANKAIGPFKDDAGIEWSSGDTFEVRYADRKGVDAGVPIASYADEAPTRTVDGGIADLTVHESDRSNREGAAAVST